MYFTVKFQICLKELKALLVLTEQLHFRYKLMLSSLRD